MPNINNKKKLSIITKPPTTKKEAVQNFLFKTKQFIKKNFAFLLPTNKRKITNIPKYGGHYAVTRSIVEGLQKTGASFNYNPSKTEDIAETVFVPGGVEALKYALNLKKIGIIKKLITGPNISELPQDIIKLENYSGIDLYLQPSSWVIDWWRKIQPDFPLKLATWYAGVDTEFWKPSENKKNNRNILLYKKNIPENIFLEFKEFFIKNNFNIETLEYGAYTSKQYLEALNRNSSLIHLTESESQGISLAEAWATNTPTIVWSPSKTKCSGLLIENCSSAPYLSDKTGESFKNLNDLENIFSKWDQNKYSPREWVIQNMSDEISAKKLMTLLEDNK